MTSVSFMTLSQAQRFGNCDITITQNMQPTLCSPNLQSNVFICRQNNTNFSLKYEASLRGGQMFKYELCICDFIQFCLRILRDTMFNHIHCNTDTLSLPYTLVPMRMRASTYVRCCTWMVDVHFKQSAFSLFSIKRHVHKNTHNTNRYIIKSKYCVYVILFSETTGNDERSIYCFRTSVINIHKE